MGIQGIWLTFKQNEGVKEEKIISYQLEKKCKSKLRESKLNQ